MRPDRTQAIAAIVSHAGVGLSMRVLALVADAGLVLFAIDDLLDERALTLDDAALRIAQYTAVARGEDCPEVAFDPIARAITDLRRRLAMTDLRGDLLAAWSDAMARMLAGMGAELPGARDLDATDLDTYLATARDSIGVAWITLTAWIATCASATRAQLPALRRAERDFSTAVRLANDLRTEARERREGRANAVTLVGDDGREDLRARCDRALVDGRETLRREGVEGTDQGRFLARFAGAIVAMYDTRDFAQGGVIVGAPRFRVPAEKSERFRELARIPGVAWPTLVALLLAVLGLPVVARGLAVGALSAPAAVACATALMYGLFTVIHDAIHGSFARRRGLNDALGSLGLLLLAPHATLGLFRWAHLQHHRHTNGPRDPDRWSHEGGITLPLRWATIDLAYAAHVLRSGDATARRHLLRALPHVAATLAVIALLVHAGYGRELVLLWLIPSRLTFVIAGCLFFWLPHVGAETTADEDALRATTMRLGHERLLTPLLQFQNYHLVHHLFPALPSSRHEAVYRLVEDDLRARPLLIQRGFALRPEASGARR